MFYALFMCGYYFFNTGLSKSAFSTYYFREKVVLSFSVLYVVFGHEFCFDVIFIELQYLYIIIVSVSAIWPSVMLFLLDKNFLFVKIL